MTSCISSSPSAGNTARTTMASKRITASLWSSSCQFLLPSPAEDWRGKSNPTPFHYRNTHMMLKHSIWPTESSSQLEVTSKRQVTVVSWYPWRNLFQNFYMDTKVHRFSSLLNKMVQYLHISYAPSSQMLIYLSGHEGSSLMHWLSLLVASGSCVRASRCVAASPVTEPRLQACGLQQLQHVGSEVGVHGLGYSLACGIFPDQVLNPCPLHWQVNS